MPLVLQLVVYLLSVHILNALINQYMCASSQYICPANRLVAIAIAAEVCFQPPNMHCGCLGALQMLPAVSPEQYPPEPPPGSAAAEHDGRLQAMHAQQQREQTLREQHHADRCA